MEQEKPYTLSQCKRDMISMWSYLAKTGSQNKSSYIEFLRKYRATSTYERFNNMYFYCPCCTYTGHDKETECKLCKRCPIAWKNKYTDGTATICCNLGSEFNLWNNSYDINERKENAAKILNLAKAIEIK